MLWALLFLPFCVIPSQEEFNVVPCISSSLSCSPYILVSTRFLCRDKKKLPFPFIQLAAFCSTNTFEVTTRGKRLSRAFDGKSFGFPKLDGPLDDKMATSICVHCVPFWATSKSSSGLKQKKEEKKTHNKETSLAQLVKKVLQLYMVKREMMSSNLKSFVLDIVGPHMSLCEFPRAAAQYTVYVYRMFSLKKRKWPGLIVEFMSSTAK